MRPVTEVTAFQTSDGQTFASESEAKVHQFDLDLEAFCNNRCGTPDVVDMLSILQHLQAEGFIILRRGV